jgi:hypothetical protein
MAINLSLIALGNVITALVDPNVSDLAYPLPLTSGLAAGHAHSVPRLQADATAARLPRWQHQDMHDCEHRPRRDEL